jgi:hypothetical protein
VRVLAKHCRSYAGPLCLRGGAEVDKGEAVGEHARVRVRNSDEKYCNMNAGEEEFLHHTDSAEDVKVVGVASLCYLRVKFVISPFICMYVCMNIY